MLLRWMRPSWLTVGTMNTMTSRDITQWATDCSRYCRVFDWMPLASGCGWNRRGETPIFRASGDSLRERADRAARAARLREITASVQRLDDVLYDLLGIAEHHHGLLHVEQRIVQARVARGHAALVDDHRAAFVHVEDRHAIDRAALLVGQRVDHVVG